MQKRVKKFAINALRRASYKLTERSSAIKKSVLRKEGRKNIYQCNYCKGEFGRNDIQVDHVHTVIPLDSSEDEVSLDIYVERLVAPPKGWQVLCMKCHTDKSVFENQLRRDYKCDKITKAEIDKKVKKYLKDKLGEK